MAPGLLPAGLCACATAAPSATFVPEQLGGHEPGAAELLPPAEILKRLRASRVVYRFERLEPSAIDAAKFADEMWPPHEAALPFPFVEDRGTGRRTLVTYPMNDEAVRILNQAEPLFQAKDYAAAEREYGRALEVAPGYYLALLSYGDCAFFSGNLQAALRRYEMAIEANPFDHRGYYYRANVLTEMGQIDEALDGYAWALATRPRHALLLQGLATREKRLGAVVQSDLLRPRSVARQDKDGVQVASDGTAHWLAFGACKAMWLGEPAHRKEMTGHEDHSITTTEEKECLASLLGVYASQREAGAIAAEPALDTLIEVVKAGMATEFILYELASRLSPHMLVLVEPAHRERLRNFVRRFVLVPAKGPVAR